jgi:hypothetical protein
MIQLRGSEVVAYLIAQQGLWVLLVWGAGAGHLWWPSLVLVPVLAAACWRAGPAWWRVAAMIGVGLCCGLAVDASLAKTGLVGYAGDDPAFPVPPAWILALWALFAAVIALPARRMLSHPAAGAVLGGIGGPLAYAGGRALGAIDAGTAGLAAVGVFYALATPILVLAANRLLPLPPRQPRIPPRKTAP